MAGGAARRISRRTASLLGGSEAVRLRLQRAGRSPDLEAFRAEQIVWAAAGLLIGGALATMLWWRRSASVGGLVVLVLAAGVGAFVGRDWLLGREADRREQRILAEFPTIADLLALSVAAGEGPVAALDRVVRTSAGELSGELRRTLADVRAGATLSDALGGLASRTGLAPLARFVDGVVVAVERGTPLADVLKAQAQDVREASRRALMETAGRKEIGMMVPVVFLVLPVTVLFAVYPGFAFMRLSL
jgi:tight adherence protein C